MTDRGRPIIFQAPMVRALLAGRKTQTRRPADIDLPQDDAEIVMSGDAGACVHIPGVGYSPTLDCPYGGPGDRLWVREAIKLADVAVGADLDRGIEGRDIAVYVADGAVVPLDTWVWKVDQLSPIFMPYGCRRLELEIEVVDIEPLQSITEGCAIAEGAFFTDYGMHESQMSIDGGKTWGTHRQQKAGWSMVETTKSEECLSSPESAFANYYNRIHAGDRWNLKPEPSPWDRNPFVWAIRFKVFNILEEP